MKKRIFAVLLAALMLFSMSVVGFAEGTSSSTSNVTTAIIGQDVIVNLKLTNNPGIAGAVFTVKCESPYVEIKDSCVTNGDIKDLGVVAQKVDAASNEVTFVVLSSEGQTISSADGETVAKVTFTVKNEPDAVGGTATIEVACSQASDGEFDEDDEQQAIVMGQAAMVFAQYTPGDVDDKEGVSLDDAIWLLKHLFNPNKYPLNQPCDFDDVEGVSLDDAIWLLKHLFNPNKYPLK